jgi:predicted ATPase
MLADVTKLPSRIPDPSAYTFNVPAIESLTTLEFSRSRLTFFTGENGSGKSTLLEAVALSYGLSLNGGNRNFNFTPDDPTDDTFPLARALKLGFRPLRSGEGFFFRAETLFNLATRIDDIGARGYGDRPLHAQSHGEAFYTVLD